MANPFPGMNPFLEDPAFWSDFHTTFIVCWRNALRASLPRGYEARIGEKVYLDEPSEAYIEILRRPDRSLVAVLELVSPYNKREPGCGSPT